MKCCCSIVLDRFHTVYQERTFMYCGQAISNSIFLLLVTCMLTYLDYIARCLFMGYERARALDCDALRSGLRRIALWTATHCAVDCDALRSGLRRIALAFAVGDMATLRLIYVTVFLFF